MAEQEREPLLPTNPRNPSVPALRIIAPALVRDPMKRSFTKLFVEIRQDEYVVNLWFPETRYRRKRSFTTLSFKSVPRNAW